MLLAEMCKDATNEIKDHPDALGEQAEGIGMSDNFKFDIMVTITDRWQLGYGQKERGDEIKKECADAVKDILEQRGFCEYREEFTVFV